MGVTVRAIEPSDERALADVFLTNWGGTQMVVRGQVFDLLAYPGFLVEKAGAIVGVLTYRLLSDEAEILSLDSTIERQGIGTTLLTFFEEAMKQDSIKRVWLITTNDNLTALAFYQKRGYRICRIYSDAVTQARALKPQIPMVAENGLPIRDEIELWKGL